jgi:hypothetical protein
MENLLNAVEQVEENNGYSLAATRIMDNRIVRRTKAIYEGRIKVFERWLRNNNQYNAAHR